MSGFCLSITSTMRTIEFLYFYRSKAELDTNDFRISISLMSKVQFGNCRDYTWHIVAA